MTDISTLQHTVAALEARVRDLEADAQIRGVLSRYAIGVDDKRPQILRELFTQDACLTIPEWKIAVQGMTEVMGFYDYYWGRFDNPRRYYANEEIKVTGDRATAFMYWHVTQERASQSVLGWGTYEWEFRNNGSAWQISSVVIRLRAMTTLSEGWAGTKRFSDV